MSYVGDPGELGDPGLSNERFELFINRKKGTIHRRSLGHALEESRLCNLNDVTDFMIVDTGMLARLLEQGMERCPHCFEITADEDVLADPKADTV